MPAKKLIPETKKRKRPTKIGNATLVSKSHPPERGAEVGHEARLPQYIKRAVVLKGQGLYLYEIAEKIKEEFGLAVAPHITTVSGWIHSGIEAIKTDIAQMQMQMRIDQWNELDRLKSKWMAIATADEMQIKRWRMEEGTLQPQIDENAIAEQLEASKMAVKCMERQAKLLGLDMAKSVEQNGEGPQSLQDLQVWFINQLNITNGPHGAPMDDPMDKVLELRHGLDIEVNQL